MVFAGIFPSDEQNLDVMNEAVEKLVLSDPAVTITKETKYHHFIIVILLFHSDVLGIGFKCGFLGMLHMDVFLQRLQAEYGTSVISTAPTVPYKGMRTIYNLIYQKIVELKHPEGTEVVVSNPSDWPDLGNIKKCYEPIIHATIIIPKVYMGAVFQLCQVNYSIYFILIIV